MKFFEQQQKARRKTKWLLLYFFSGVIGTILFIYFAVLFLLCQGSDTSRFHWWNPEVFIFVFIFTLLIILFATIKKLIELSSGGKAIAIALGGEPVYQSKNLEEQRLLNIVNEMAIASGVPIPEVYVLRRENGINAFAAGNSPADAVIGVTGGSLKHLNRDELQGVIAHEFSHILNGDMRLNVKLIAVIAGILAISEIGYAIIGMRTRGKKAGQLKLLGLVLLVAGSCGAIFARIIQSAISRQREYLADAAAVQFTRNPAGIAGALKKILSLTHGSTIQSPESSQVAHMFFSKGFSSILSDLFSTHPPIEKRIKAIEEMGAGMLEVHEEVPLVDKDTRIQPDTFSKTSPRFTVSHLTESIGAINISSTNYYNNLISSLEPTITESLKDLFDSTALVYALLLSEDERIRNNQIEILTRNVSSTMLNAVARKFKDIKNLPRIKKLPLAHLSIVTMRRMSRDQFNEFEKTVDSLMRCDNSIDIFEFAISKIIKRNLSAHFKPQRKLRFGLMPQPAFKSFEPIKRECAVLLSALAWCGHDNEESAENAFKVGAQMLGFINNDFQFLPFEQCDLMSIDRALENCLKLEPFLRETLINACSTVVSEDNVLTAFEAELLRAIADTLECPIPPILLE